MLLLVLVTSGVVSMAQGIMPTPAHTTRPHIYTTYGPTRPPPSTLDPNSCLYDGKVYENGEDIEKDPENCYGMYCEAGDIIHWDAACFFGTSPCNGVNVDVPGQCCPECITTTTPEQTTTPPPPEGCNVNGTFYEYGSDIPQKDPCKTCTCTKENGVMCAMQSCAPVRCVNPKKNRNQCCPTCPDGPNCWYGMKKIKVGEVYSPSPNVECTCPDPYEPLACCRKLPKNKTFLKKQLKKQKWYMNPMLKLYIEKYLGR